MKKFSEFPQATSLTEQDLLLISQYNGVDYETKYIKGNVSSGVPVKEFIAMIEQTGTSAPNITVIKDDFNDTYTTAYNSTGNYDIIGFNNELTGDEEIYINMNNVPVGFWLQTFYSAPDTINIVTSDLSSVPQDAVILYATYIRVTKYL